MPWLDNIAELLLVLAPLFLMGAWIATGSERSSYIGTQMVVTFALATLENVFGPTYDLVEIRDRAFGILIGTLVSAVIYTFVWPESEAKALPQKLASSLGLLSKLLRIPRQQDAVLVRTYLQMRIGLHATFNACDEMCERVALEHQLPGDERMALIQRSQRVIHLAVTFSMPGIPPEMTPRRWITRYCWRAQHTWPMRWKNTQPTWQQHPAFRRRLKTCPHLKTFYQRYPNRSAASYSR